MQSYFYRQRVFLISVNEFYLEQVSNLRSIIISINPALSLLFRRGRRMKAVAEILGTHAQMLLDVFAEE